MIENTFIYIYDTAGVLPVSSRNNHCDEQVEMFCGFEQCFH